MYPTSTYRYSAYKCAHSFTSLSHTSQILENHALCLEGEVGTSRECGFVRPRIIRYFGAPFLILGPQKSRINIARGGEPGDEASNVFTVLETSASIESNRHGRNIVVVKGTAHTRLKGICAKATDTLLKIGCCGSTLCLYTCSRLRVLGHGYCAALKECADLGFVVN